MYMYLYICVYTVDLEIFDIDKFLLGLYNDQNEKHENFFNN